MKHQILGYFIQADDNFTVYKSITGANYMFCKYSNITHKLIFAFTLYIRTQNGVK